MREGRAAKRARMGVPDLQVVAVSAQLCRICELGAFCNMLHGLTGGGVGGAVGAAAAGVGAALGSRAQVPLMWL